jgi:hypothetical protein
MRKALLSLGSVLFSAARRTARQRQQYILVLAHMRSGSTLLHHLLQTNPFVLGAGESNQTIESRMDLMQLSLRTHYRANSVWNWHQYVTDYSNHTRQLRNVSLLLSPDVRTIFLIREPRGAIGSMVSELARHYQWSFAQSIDYYYERTSALCKLAGELGSRQPTRAFALTYDSLTSDTSAALGALQRHLGLSQPFSSNYKVHAYTGKRGDPSDRIRAGNVLKGNAHNDLTLSLTLERELHQHYLSALSVLRCNCSGYLGDNKAG